YLLTSITSPKSLITDLIGRKNNNPTTRLGHVVWKNISPSALISPLVQTQHQFHAPWGIISRFGALGGGAHGLRAHPKYQNSHHARVHIPSTHRGRNRHGKYASLHESNYSFQGMSSPGQFDH